MFRLLPVYRDVVFWKSLLSSRHYMRSHGVSSMDSLLRSPWELYFHSVSNTEDLLSRPCKRSRNFDVEILFNACTTPEIAKRVHALLIVLGKQQSAFVATRLVNIYSHLGDVASSQETFRQIPSKDSYTWNSMVSSYVRNHHFREAVNCVLEMLTRTDVRPDFYTFPPVLKACHGLPDGTRFHCWVLKLGFEWDVFVASSLVHMYCRMGFANSAYTIFQDMPSRDMGCWNSIISGFCQNGNAKEALDIFDCMIKEGINMDSVTVASILSICAQVQIRT